MRVNRIDHINIRTSQLAETCSFYQQVLGLERGVVMGEGVDQVRNAWLYDEEKRPIIHVNMPNEGELEMRGGDTGKLDHVALDCNGFDEMVDRLETQGVEHRIAVFEKFNFKQIFIHDPNGVRLELNFAKG
jgi:catechol 2,3-dioxygenase-like lactoylglutathione lyase family enzyme